VESCNNLKVIVVGLGSIGMRHARNLKELNVGEILGVDIDISRHKKFTKEIGSKVFDNLIDGLRNKPDLSIIASPNRFHIEQAQICANSNCHLFIEKPLGISQDGVEKLIKTVNKKNLFAHVGSNWKFHKSFQTMKELLDKGKIGQVTGAQVIAGQWLPDWHPWEDYRQGYSARKDLGGGIVFDNHEFDYITWLLGPVEKMEGFSSQSGALEINTEDVACACLKMKSGALITVHIDYIQRKSERRYHISGAEGTIKWDISKDVVEIFNADEKSSQFIKAPIKNLNKMYIDQMCHVLAGAMGTETPVTPLKAAQRVLSLQLDLIS